MGRATQIAFYIMCFSLSMSLLNQINLCYQYGSLMGGCPSEPGMGRQFFPMPTNGTLIGYQLHDANGNVINPSDINSYNATMQNTVAYAPAPSGITDIFGFFTWVLAGGRLIVNAFFMPLFGFPQLLTQFYVPTFVTYPIGTLLMLIQIVGLYEFFSGREII